MFNSKLNARRGFHPRRCGSPDAITPEQVLRHHRSAQGRHGGTGTVPSFIRTSILNFISREKEFYRAQITVFLKKIPGHVFCRTLCAEPGCSLKYLSSENIPWLLFDEVFFKRHFFDFFIDIGTVFHTVPVIIAHSHKKIAGRTFNPGFKLVREFCVEG